MLKLVLSFVYCGRLWDDCVDDWLALALYVLVEGEAHKHNGMEPIKINDVI